MSEYYSKKDALLEILKDQKSYKTSLNYAVAYTRAAITMEEGSDKFETQMLYVLNNITRWRHPNAKDVRATLRRKV